MFALPGFLAVALLAEPGNARRRALFAVLAAGLGGAAAWFAFAGPRLPAPASLLAAEWLRRGVAGARDAVRASAMHLTLGLACLPDAWTPWVLLPPALASAWLRRDLPWRPLLGFLVLAMVPLLAILTLRQAPGVWKISRYAYQPSFFWCLALGAAVAAAVRRLPGPRRTVFAGAFLAVAAAALLFAETAAARRSRDSWSAHTVTQWTFWSHWDSFFELASAHRRQIGKPLALPNYPLQLPYVDLHRLYRLCHPFGLPGLTLAHGHALTPEDEAEFWREVDRASFRLPGFDPRRILARPDSPGGESRPRF